MPRSGPQPDEIRPPGRHRGSHGNYLRQHDRCHRSTRPRQAVPEPLGADRLHAFHSVRLSVADHLRLGAHLNPGWDAKLARDRVGKLGLDPAQKAGKLSGGQRAQLALTLAIAKRPGLLILDEPVASLDPLARREFLDGLLEATHEHQMSVVLSSHLVTDLEQVCDYLIVLTAARVQVAGPVAELLATHRTSLEDLVLAYLSQATATTSGETR
jgi:ABC-type multidrug transport system ATPase subunit